MGSELQIKYQRLAQEYAKLRGHVDVLKKAVKEEKSVRETLEEGVREKTLSLRKHVQENESLEFRNQQLSKRVEMLQDDLGSPVARRKKKATGGGVGGGVAVDGVMGSVSSEVQTQELAAKISENEQLHLKVSELTHKSGKAAAALEATKTKLESEMASFTEAMEQKERERRTEVEAMTNNRAMLEAKLAKYNSELMSMKGTLQREQELSSRLRESSPIGLVSSNGRSDTGHQERYGGLNVPVVDAKLQGRVLVSLRASQELVTSFATQLSTFHSYLQQRCKIYPIDASTGSQITIVNQKLCKLLHSSSSSYTKPLISAFSQYSGKLHANPYATPTGSSGLVEFSLVHTRLVVYLDTLTPYLQISLQQECGESVCGVQLTDVNLQISNTLPLLVASFSTADSYLSLLARGPVEGVAVSSLPVCLHRLKLSVRHLHKVLEALHNLYSSKITLEYQLPSSSQKLSTTNECIVSVLSGLTLTALQICEVLEEHNEVFSAALAQGTPTNTQTEVVSSQELIVQLEQENERTKLDLQLLEVKYEKEQKKVKRLEEELSRGPSVAVLTPAQSRSSLGVATQVQSLSDSVGSLSIIEEEVSDESVREELIREHFTKRILQVKAETQEVESKATHYYAESRAVMKQLNHNVALRVKLAQDLDTARETIQHLQDQLAITSSSYEKQLSTMSDHLCELNDKMMKQNEELEMLRRYNKGKRRAK